MPVNAMLHPIEAIAYFSVLVASPAEVTRILSAVHNLDLTPLLSAGISIHFAGPLVAPTGVLAGKAASSPPSIYTSMVAVIAVAVAACIAIAAGIAFVFSRRKSSGHPIPIECAADSIGFSAATAEINKDEDSCANPMLNEVPPFEAYPSQ